MKADGNGEENGVGRERRLEARVGGGGGKRSVGVWVWVRWIHLYLGVFFAPLLLLFVATGWYQTVDRDRLKSPSEAETLMQKLRVVHTDQIYPTDHEVRRPSSPAWFQRLVGVMSGAMILATLAGVGLAIRYGRPRGGVIGAMAMGVVVPIVILMWVQRR